jgi:catechol 2,3-dioxygenase-like lactoylglutathione lyase family enzyme
VSDLAISEAFYDCVMLDALDFRKNKFTLAGDPHIQYFNRHFGFVLRPARTLIKSDSHSSGLHHFCLRVTSTADVDVVAAMLRSGGIEVSVPKLYPEHAHDYWAIYFSDPDGVRLEVTNYRQERRDRHDNWTPIGA